MRTMFNMTVIALSIGLAGCACRGPRDTGGESVYGVPCSPAGQTADRVVINIVKEGNGAPAGRPDRCTVKPGTRITWISEDAFVLKFKKGSPAEGESLVMRSEIGLSGHEKTITAKRVESTTDFPYGITANGFEVDPSIIIER